MQESQKNATFIDDRERRFVKDDVTAIYGMIKDMFDYQEGEDTLLKYENLKQRVLAKGFSSEALDKTIEHYCNLNVLFQDKNGDLMYTEI